MNLGGTETLIVSFASSFILLALLHQNEEGWFGRSFIVSILLGVATLLLPFGLIGYGIGLVASFIILMLVQKYSFLSALLFLIVAGLLSYIIQLGIYKYF